VLLVIAAEKRIRERYYGTEYNININILYPQHTEKSNSAGASKKMGKGQRRKRMSAMLSGFLCNISCQILGYHIFHWKSRRDYVSTFVGRVGLMTHMHGFMNVSSCVNIMYNNIV